MTTRQAHSRNRGGGLAPPSSRPASVLARSGTRLQRDTRAPPEEASDHSEHLATSMQSSHTQNAKKQNSSQDETNIQVVIRCRRRSEREVQECSPIIVTADGARSQQITIETAAPTSLLGVVTLPPTRTYPFDMVFGPEADQAMVYQDVVHPMLDEVIKGYNCTLFAYGQTGTGKTYTMQGDVTLTPLGNPSVHAGMIPRVLFKLFNQLESSGADYSVKISYVELYNEELRDLLASELSAPVGSAQPMGLGPGKDKDAQGALKIYDDSSKKGVFIQGLEETPVKDFSDALALLEKGSQRRQIAATKFNDHSSRSHSIFSITVHSKEVSSLGDDLLKVGKLNLVDLAGSENIGRSGAENKRAREAGMINQSLLTLGRVINALVDHSSHVPYRESKLTRLLQDSLGGRTKTCIIATVSPARSNMEETLSTLDYAIRAKSIRNKPEVNQRMTRNALLKEYIAEIERLKADVLATREKNGIYFSEETWTQLNAEHEMRQTEMNEAKKHIELVESQMRAVREEFEQSITLLMKTDSELKNTKESLKSRENELHERTNELRQVRTALEEEVVVREAHANSEDALNNVASSLRSVVHESTRDISGLFDKLDRQKAQTCRNVNTVTSLCSQLDANSKRLLSALEEFTKTSQQQIGNTKSMIDSFKRQSAESLLSHRGFLFEQSKIIQEQFQVVSKHEEMSQENFEQLRQTITEVKSRLAVEATSWSSSTQKDVDAMCNVIEGSAMKNFKLAEQSVDALGTVLFRTIQEALSTLEKNKKFGEQQKEVVSGMVEHEVVRLRQQNSELTKLLEIEKQNSQKARDDLIRKVSSLLVNFAEQRDRGLGELVHGIQDSNTRALDGIQRAQEQHDSLIMNQSKRHEAWRTTLEEASQEGTVERDSAKEALRVGVSSLQSGIINLQEGFSKAIKTQNDGLAKHGSAISSAVKMFDRERVTKRARLETLEKTSADIRNVFDKSGDVINSTNYSIESFDKTSHQAMKSAEKATKAFYSNATTHIRSVQEQNHAILDSTIHEEAPTGTTPRKRRWNYADSWERTLPRDAILQNYRTSRRGQLPSPSTWQNAIEEAAACKAEDSAGSQEQPIVVSVSSETVTVKEEAEVDSNLLASPETLTESEPILPELSPPISLSMPQRTQQIPVLKSVAGKELPARGQLREKSTNIFEGRTRRRR